MTSHNVKDSTLCVVMLFYSLPFQVCHFGHNIWIKSQANPPKNHQKYKLSMLYWIISLQTWTAISNTWRIERGSPKGQGSIHRSCGFAPEHQIVGRTVNSYQIKVTFLKVWSFSRLNVRFKKKFGKLSRHSSQFYFWTVRCS